MKLFRLKIIIKNSVYVAYTHECRFGTVADSRPSHLNGFGLVVGWPLKPQTTLKFFQMANCHCFLWAFLTQPENSFKRLFEYLKWFVRALTASLFAEIPESIRCISPLLNFFAISFSSNLLSR